LASDFWPNTSELALVVSLTISSALPSLLVSKAVPILRIFDQQLALPATIKQRQNRPETRPMAKEYDDDRVPRDDTKADLRVAANEPPGCGKGDILHY
jgi:hypothetical protein